MKAISVGILVGTLFVIVLPAGGNQFMGGKGFLHTSSALLMPPGALDMSFYARGTVIPKRKTSTGEEYTATNGTSAFSTAFGFTRRVELGLTQILYQDLNLTGLRNVIDSSVAAASAMIPGDTYLRLKIGGWNIGEKAFWSIIPALHYRVGRFHDVQLEPYESYGVETELIGSLSYFQKPFYPDEALSVHLNVGYINHNDAENPTEAAQSVNYLISGIYPQRYFDFGLELYGSRFVKRPSVYVLSREDWTYATPFVRYKMFKGLNFTLGIDALLQGSKETSVTNLPDIVSFPSNYSKWRVSGRVSFTPSTTFYLAPTFAKVDETGTGRSRMGADAMGGGSMDRQSLFRWAVEERGGGVEAADLDLQKIRQERIKAEEELKRLKRKLEEKQGK